MRQAMKTKMAWVLLWMILIASLTTMSYPVQAAESGIYNLNPSKTAVKIGDIITIQVVGTQIKNLFAYEFLLNYPEDILILNDKPVSAIPGTTFYKKREDAVQFGCTQIDKTLVSGVNKPVCTLSFTAKASGSATVSIAWLNTLDFSLTSAPQKTGNAVNIAVESSDESIPTQIVPVIQGNGDALVTVDESALAQAFLNNNISVMQVKPIPGTDTYVIDLPVNDMKNGSKDHMLTLQTEFAHISFPMNWLDNQSFKDGSTLSLVVAIADSKTFSSAQRLEIGNHTVLDIYVMINGKKITWQNDHVKMLISIPYQPTENEKKEPNHIVVKYLNKNGTSESVASGQYDANSGMVTFLTHHLSQYTIAWVKKTFQDLSKAEWARTAIEVLASKGTIQGVSSTQYLPNANITRADYLKLLITVLDLDAPVLQNFSDVNTSDYYYKTVGIAKALGITTGTGNNQFSPKATITRQDMIVMTEKAMRMTDKTLEIGHSENLSQFKDANGIADYAKNSMAVFVDNQLVTGNNGLIMPKGVTTRAQAAVILYRIYYK